MRGTMPIFARHHWLAAVIQFGDGEPFFCGRPKPLVPLPPAHVGYEDARRRSDCCKHGQRGEQGLKQRRIVHDVGRHDGGGCRKTGVGGGGCRGGCAWIAPRQGRDGDRPASSCYDGRVGVCVGAGEGLGEGGRKVRRVSSVLCVQPSHTTLSHSPKLPPDRLRERERPEPPEPTHWPRGRTLAR